MNKIVYLTESQYETLMEDAAVEGANCTHFIIRTDNNNGIFIVDALNYKDEQAKEMKNIIRLLSEESGVPVENYHLVNRNYLTKRGIDPSDDTYWEETSEEDMELTEAKSKAKSKAGRDKATQIKKAFKKGGLKQSEFAYNLFPNKDKDSARSMLSKMLNGDRPLSDKDANKLASDIASKHLTITK